MVCLASSICMCAHCPKSDPFSYQLDCKIDNYNIPYQCDVTLTCDADVKLAAEMVTFSQVEVENACQVYYSC